MNAKKRFVTTTMATLLLVTFHPGDIRAQQHRVVFAKVHSSALEGNLLGDSPHRNVTVYLPPGYDENSRQRYPVLYLLHGYMGSNYWWTTDAYTDQEVNVALVADSLIKTKTSKPLIIVCPDARNKFRGSWYTNSPVTGGWEDFVTKELVDYVDKNYRTLPVRDSRGIAGLSMGGHGALKLAMKHPEVYGAVYAISPAWTVFSEAVLKRNRKMIQALVATENPRFGELQWRTQAAIALAAAVAPNPDRPPFYGDLPLDAEGGVIEATWQQWLEHDLCTLIGTHCNNLNQLRGLGLECGTEDVLIDEVRVLSKTLADAGIEHAYLEHDGGHVDRVAQRLHDHVLPFFSSRLKHEMPPNFLGTILAERTRNQVKIAHTQVRALATALRIYQLDIGSLPTSQQGLQALRNPPADLPDQTKWNGPYLRDEVPLDPWSNRYQYELIAPGKYRVLSAGPDGQSGTEDDAVREG